MTCTHCTEIVATYRDIGDVIGPVCYGDSTLSLPRWPVAEVLACECRCHDVWKRWGA